MCCDNLIIPFLLFHFEKYSNHRITKIVSTSNISVWLFNQGRFVFQYLYDYVSFQSLYSVKRFYL